MSETVSYKCPHCTAPLTFKPGADNVVCDYCGDEFAIKTIVELFARQEEAAAKERQAKEQKWDTEAAGGEWSAEEATSLRAFACSACGAEIVCDENTMATECCYCGNPTMLPARFDGLLKPDLIIPFQKTKEEAVAALKEFYKGKYLLPSSFTRENRVEAIQPMYVPFWLFDAQVEADAVFRAEKVRRYKRGKDEVVETKYYSCHRVGRMRFRKIPADGSRKMDDAYMDSIEPFDYDGLVPFSSAYLAGFLADKYDVTAEECAARADTRMENTAFAELQRRVPGYDYVRRESGSVVKEQGDVVYAMVPVWILSTKYRGKVYTFMMNGQTGKVVGSLPYDKGKAILYPAAAALLLWPVFFFLIMFLGES